MMTFTKKNLALFSTFFKTLSSLTVTALAFTEPTHALQAKEGSTTVRRLSKKASNQTESTKKVNNEPLFRTSASRVPRRVLQLETRAQKQSIRVARAPTAKSTSAPTAKPSSVPTWMPSNVLSDMPSFAPSSVPTSGPTSRPTSGPTSRLTSGPTSSPTDAPSAAPTDTVILNSALPESDIESSSSKASAGPLVGKLVVFFALMGGGTVAQKYSRNDDERSLAAKA